MVLWRAKRDVELDRFFKHSEVRDEAKPETGEILGPFVDLSILCRISRAHLESFRILAVGPAVGAFTDSKSTAARPAASCLLVPTVVSPLL